MQAERPDGFMDGRKPGGPAEASRRLPREAGRPGPLAAPGVPRSEVEESDVALAPWPASSAGSGTAGSRGSTTPTISGRSSSASPVLARRSTSWNRSGEAAGPWGGRSRRLSAASPPPSSPRCRRPTPASSRCPGGRRTAASGVWKTGRLHQRRDRRRSSGPSMRAVEADARIDSADLEGEVALGRV